MNNTDEISFWDYPLYFQIFVIFILICTAMTDLCDFFILIVIYQLIGNIAYFNCTILFIILFTIMLVGIILATILKDFYDRHLAIKTPQ